MKKFLVIGNPIKHSLSPQLHNYWIKQNNINAIYDKKKVNTDQLKDLVMDIKHKNIHGINVTVPFKKTVIPLMDELSDEAKKTQSVNTIYLKNNRVIGHNTDIGGFEFAINKINFSFFNKKVFILGAGGVVPSIIYSLLNMRVSKILITNRTKVKAEFLKNFFNNIELVEWGEVPDFDIIINATSLGLNTSDKINLNFSKIKKNKLFYDVIYNPSETNFLKIGKKTGNQCENGKLMFIYQALLAFRIWHDLEPDVTNETIEILNQ